ncbi:hypothetical protein C2845_PM15G24590 [Panicum miliaceum]|uniref:RING-type domain-containing protein n=1 Tax=Panicum miliaceum TaxID=4540 RepID=A0A3L6Q4Q9_PANMI|nr:hypothetical protein C2845_PM15G24590 [Panicum miliaceum]
MEGHRGFAPLDEGPSYLRLTSRVTVRYAWRRLGGGGVDELVRAEPAPEPDSEQLVVDPSDFLDYDRTRLVAWRLFSRLPGLRGLDLAPSNWYMFAPDEVAARILRDVRWNDARGLCGGHCRRFALDMHVEATLVFNEPKALLRYCSEEVMQTLDPRATVCGICSDGLTSSGRTPPVNLPCSHAFHSQCITRWFFKGTACPVCRHDLRTLVAAPPWASTGHVVGMAA